MHNNPVALVTGANKGIGLQIAKDLAARGLTALVGSRNLKRGETAAKSVGANARALQLDVANQASIAAAAERIRSAKLGRALPPQSNSHPRFVVASGPFFAAARIGEEL
jgi:NAD(P)-dependent dehydrogenase (short-subunit alcohol dehydrogenase family)